LTGSLECKPDSHGSDELLNCTGQVPSHFRGKSTFTDSKLIRFISRSGIPGLFAHDLENSHLNLIWSNLPVDIKSQMPCLDKYIHDS
jgi:hypothetical protein